MIIIFLSVRPKKNHRQNWQTGKRVQTCKPGKPGKPGKPANQQTGKPANTNLTKLMQTFLQQIPKNSIYIGNEDI